MTATSTSPRWVRRPEGSNWGEFGPDDQVGRLNLITSHEVLQGVAEVREGLRLCLSLPLDYPGGNTLLARRHPPRLRAVVRNDRPAYNYPVDQEWPGATDVSCDESVVLHTQYSTQWDSLAHIGAMFDADGDGIPEMVYYNGFRAGEHVVGPPSPPPGGNAAFEPVGARALGIENMAATGVQGRGVMVDLWAHFGRDNRRIGYGDLMAVLEADRAVIERGDMVCFHTGFGEQLLEWGKTPDPTLVHRTCCGLDGRDLRLHQWIDESGLSVLVSDNIAVEFVETAPRPGHCGPMLPIHELCLFKLGIHLGELWYLSELAAWLRANKRHRFLLTAPPLRLPGAVGSPVTPVATV
jgi:hypothetical protein